jgi:hypothetical protein
VQHSSSVLALEQSSMLTKQLPDSLAFGRRVLYGFRISHYVEKGEARSFSQSRVRRGSALNHILVLVIHLLMWFLKDLEVTYELHHLHHEPLSFSFAKCWGHLELGLLDL